ncbi:MAG: MBL fold metallo-hydrolase [bacterium]|nr:MBL fold metallo-hydrolase [bacterium]
MRVVVLSSGSRGNTTYIEINNIKILIDFGNSNKYVCDKLAKLEVSPSEIDYVFLTHTHNDHIKGLEVFLKKNNPTVFLTKTMHEKLPYLNKYKYLPTNVLTINNINIDIINTSHDVESRGYIISYEEKSLVYITDTGYINQKYFPLLKNKTIYIMESNHDVEMLMNGRYQFPLKQRILGDKGHLSNIDSAKYLEQLIGLNTKYIILAHLSEENNNPHLAYETISTRLINKNINNIFIATQNKETETIEI